MHARRITFVLWVSFYQLVSKWIEPIIKHTHIQIWEFWRPYERLLHCTYHNSYQQEFQVIFHQEDHRHWPFWRLLNWQSDVSFICRSTIYVWIRAVAAPELWGIYLSEEAKFRHFAEIGWFLPSYPSDWGTVGKEVKPPNGGQCHLCSFCVNLKLR